MYFDIKRTKVIIELPVSIKGNKISMYFSHKMPDYISVYSEIYMGFTLKEPYDIIPLINNCDPWYNKALLSRIHNIDDLEDFTRETPCPPSPYK